MGARRSGERSARRVFRPFMVFNSLVFLVFLAVVLALYYRLGLRGQNVLLVVASYFFYGWWDWRFLGLLLFSTFFDYWCALRLEAETDAARKKRFLAFSMLINLGILGVFKYFNFFAEGFAQVLGTFGLHADLPTLHVLLPVGISFYTFLSMSYTIDVYRGELRATRNPLEFMLYVSFFPHLVAGPIVRASYLLPQCQQPRVIRRDEVLNGIWLCLLGYVKKMVIADRLAALVEWGFASGQPPFADPNAWLIVYAFAFQIYGDFAGYTDIARGLSKIMGFELVTNFRAPYLVTNPAAFWRHWHISLSVWLRDYLYIPLGGNRGSALRTYRNLLLTMLLGGLWHGAGLAYVAWGLYHGLLLIAHRLWQTLASGGGKRGKPDESSPARPRRIGAWLGHAALVVVFFHVTCLGWLLFRAGALGPKADQWAAIRSYLAAMFRPALESGISPLVWPVALLGGLALFLQWKHDAMDHFSRWHTGSQACAVVLALSAICALGIFEGSSFIYFQF